MACFKWTTLKQRISYTTLSGYLMPLIETNECSYKMSVTIESETANRRPLLAEEINFPVIPRTLLNGIALTKVPLHSLTGKHLF